MYTDERLTKLAMQSFKGHEWFDKYRAECNRLVTIAEEMDEDEFDTGKMPTDAEAETWLKWKAGKASKKRDADGRLGMRRCRCHRREHADAFRLRGPACLPPV